MLWGLFICESSCSSANEHKDCAGYWKIMLSYRTIEILKCAWFYMYIHAAISYIFESWKFIAACYYKFFRIICFVCYRHLLDKGEIEK